MTRLKSTIDVGEPRPSCAFATGTAGGLALPSPPCRRQGYFAAAILSGLALLAVVPLARLAGHVLYPFPLDMGEGAVLSAAWHAACGRSVYNVIAEPPFIFSIYNPVLIYLAAAVFRLLGPSLAGPRLLVAAFHLATAYFVYRFVLRETASKTAAAAAALFLLLARPFVSRGGYATTDFPGIFFSVLGLYLWRTGGRSRALSIAAFAFAFWSKQTSIIAAAAAFTALFLEGRRVESVKFLAAFLAVIGAGFAAAWLCFGAAFFVNTFSYARVADFDARFAARSVIVAFALYPLPVAGWLLLARRALREPVFILPVVYVLFGLLAAFTVGRHGASRSYFFDFVAGLAIVAGYLWAAVETRLSRRGNGGANLRARISGAALVAAVVLQLGLIGAGALHSMRLSGDATPSDRRHDAFVRDAFVQGSGVILCHEMGFDVGMRAICFTNDVFKMQQLFDAGIISPEILLAPVRARKFSAVVMPVPGVARSPFDASIRAAVLEHYEALDEAHGEMLLIRRNRDGREGNAP